MNATYTIHETPVLELEKLAEHAREAAHAAKFALMVVAAPLMGLVFVIAGPLAGLAYLVWMAVRTPAAKRIALFAAAPFIGLAYAIALPFVGMGALAYCAVKAARN